MTTPWRSVQDAEKANETVAWQALPCRQSRPGGSQFRRPIGEQSRRACEYSCNFAGQWRGWFPSGGVGPFDAVVADFNGDGKNDVAVTIPAGGISILLGDGLGHLGA